MLVRMASEHLIQRYRYWYAKLLRLYSKSFYERFGEGMEQTFNDLLRERAEEERGLFSCALWMFVETTAGIMREHVASMIAQNITKRLSAWAAVVALILLVPLVAMQFTVEVKWDLFDFAFMGSLLFGTGLAYELVARKSGTITYRAAVGIALATSLILVWVNGAVGIIGDGPVNLMYSGVLAVGIIGAIVAHLEPRGMARTLFAMAIAQMMVPVISLMVWDPPFDPGVVPVLGLNGFFAMLFVGSALLFRRATRQHG